ncbi:MAG: SDR family oxidoreductase [Bacteroidetes bacterium]|nr:SDR family oxidoreductase [Bacteroidota bacterium]
MANSIPKKILITGTNGLLGQKLVYALMSRNDYEVVATARGENRLLSKQGYIYESLDISNVNEVKEILSKHKPQIIIHGAAMTNVDECEIKKEECWKINVDAVKYLADAAEEISAHFIHVSTDFIFDGTEGPYTEEGHPNPLSYYGESKLAAEEIVKKYKGQWAIARTVLVYGLVDNMSRSNIVLWAKGALEKGVAVNVVNDQYRTPTLAEDLAQGCILIAEKNACGIFNISGKDYLNIVEIVEKVADFYALDKSLIRPVSSETLNQLAKRPPITGFVLDKAYKELSYQPHSFDEGILILDQQMKIMTQ